MPRYGAPDHAWLFDVLVGTDSAVWAPAGQLPAGYELAEQIVILPAGRGRSFMVSLGSRRGAASALTSYNRLRGRRTRAVRQVIGLGLRTGLAPYVFPNRIDIGVRADAAAGPDDALLTGYLCTLFGRGPVVVAFGAGSGPYRKPVLQVFDADGIPLGYVKVGWNDWTKQAVRRETAALRACTRSGARFGVPGVLDQVGWRGLELLVTAPLPPGVRRMPMGSELPAASILREISQLSAQYTGELLSSPWWLALQRRIESCAGQPGIGARLLALADQIERTWGSTVLRFGAWHGDFVPWNLAWHGDRLYAWDWESSDLTAPAGFDALHFHFQVAFVGRRRPLAEAAAIAEQKAAATLAGLGVPATDHHLHAVLHLTELLVRHEEARASTADADDRFFPSIISVLENSLRCSRGPGLPAVERSS